jgi:signal transduction histidine kinase
MAHSLVAINVRSSVALDLEGSQDPHEALQDIKQASVTALRDLRTTLELLREPKDAAPTAPPLDLDGLPGLLAHTQATGLRADLDVDLGGAAIPSAIGTAAYRIVQEALTNVLRHANATRAHVRVHAEPDQLDVEIIDDGQADSSDASPGLGLRGMVERSTTLGGRISAGPLQDRGWRVHAMLPLAGRNGSAS